jgi:hypothetical protein
MVFGVVLMWLATLGRAVSEYPQDALVANEIDFVDCPATVGAPEAKQRPIAYCRAIEISMSMPKQHGGRFSSSGSPR